MSSYVESIEATGIYDRFDLKMEFQSGVNIIFGRNGTGKTTLIQILANALNGEYGRFVFLDFDSIRIRLDDGTVSLSRRRRGKEDEEIRVKAGRRVVQRIPIEPIKTLLEDPRRRRRLSPKQLSLFDEADLSPRDVRRFLDPYTSDEGFEPLLATAYFPAFRTMIDAWVSSVEEREPREGPDAWTALVTRPARRWFGKFVPSVNYPSLLEIEQRLTAEIQRARITIGRADRELLSQAFLEIFASLSREPIEGIEQPEEILEEIRSLFDRLEESPLQEESSLVTRVYSELRESIHDLDLSQESERTAIRVLDVYRHLLEEIVSVQERSFVDIQRYLESVNEFLEGKRLIVDPSIPRFRGPSVGIGFGNQTSSMGLRALSSGERQIVTLIYAASHMSEQQVVLIDEPEISLHVDWQRRLLGKMAEQIGDRQIIACTHSPVIAAEYESRQRELVLETTSKLVGENNEGVAS